MGNNRNYVWGELYEAALLETDDKKLPSCLQAAKAAFDRRVQEMRADRTSTSEELRAIVDARNSLKILRLELDKRTW